MGRSGILFLIGLAPIKNKRLGQSPLLAVERQEAMQTMSMWSGQSISPPALPAPPLFTTRLILSTSIIARRLWHCGRSRTLWMLTKANRLHSALAIKPVYGFVNGTRVLAPVRGC